MTTAMSISSSSCPPVQTLPPTMNFERDAVCGVWELRKTSSFGLATAWSGIEMSLPPWRRRCYRRGKSSMLTPREELVQSWLVKALHDLATARKAAAEPDPYLDTAIYHCQQAGEKAVKGFLAFHDQPPVRTHDIELLLSMAEPFETGFAVWFEAGERLTRYATQYRYPGDAMEPEQDEFVQAMADADGLFEFVLSVLPAALHPAA